MTPPLTDKDRDTIARLIRAGTDGVSVLDCNAAELRSLAYLAHWGEARTRIRKHGALAYVHESFLVRPIGAI